MSPKTLQSLWMIAALGLLCFFSIPQFFPIAPRPESAPAEHFSAARALSFAQPIAQPRPMGSAQHAHVRDALLARLNALPASPQIQHSLSVYPEFGATGFVDNILVRVRGSTTQDAILLVTHYDSQPQTPGALDNASGTLVLLETLRAFLTGPMPKNDVIFLFSDGEDTGILGSAAFLNQHPWMRDVRVVFNLDSVTSFPQIAIETGPQNGWVLSEFARGVAQPYAYAWIYDTYRSLLTHIEFDFTPFKRAGLAGLNFTTIDQFSEYHNAADRPERLDPDGIQHAGDVFLGLARHFGQIDLSVTYAPEQIFFNFFSLWVMYPANLAPLLAGAAGLLAVGGVILQVRRGQLSWKRLGLGQLSFLGLALLEAACFSLLWAAIGWLDPQAAIARVSPHLANDWPYLPAFLSVGLSLFCASTHVLQRWISLQDLFWGALGWSGLLALLTAWVLPGFSYLLLWPFLSGMGAAAAWLRFPESSWKRWLAFGAAALIPLGLFAPLIFMQFLGLGLALPAASAGVATLLFGLLIPAFSLIRIAPWTRWLPAGLAGIGICLLAFKLLTAQPAAGQPRFNDIGYLFNADRGQAYWVSRSAAQPDAWQEQFFGHNNPNAVQAGAFPALHGTSSVLVAPAPLAGLESPDLAVLSDRFENGQRRLRLRIITPRQAHLVSVLLAPNLPIAAAWLEGQPVKNILLPANLHPQSWRRLDVHAPPAQGFELELNLDWDGPFEIYLQDESLGLPAIPGFVLQPRPDGMASAGDYTWTKKMVKFPAPKTAFLNLR